MKWFVYAAAFVAICFPASIGILGDGRLNVVLFPLIPTGAGVAVLKYRLYEIDRIISRTISYASLTALSAGIFALLVLAPTAALGSRPKVASWLVALATLVVAFLFQPLRRRVQSFVDRRFDRARYDADRLVEAFSSRLRQSLDVEALASELNVVVSQALHPRSVSVWLRRTD